MPTLRLSLLGPLEIRADDQLLAKPPTLNAQSLLAYLVLHRDHPQPRERLADLFWGDRPERKARRSLTTALWHIRRCLPPSDEEWLLGDVHAVQFDPAVDVWLDVAEFESRLARPELSSLRSAIALYRGPFMDGFYDDWVLNERYRLETLFSEALARLMLGLEGAGDHEGALVTGRRLLDHDPLREDAHRLAMRVLCRLGRRNAALEQYQRCQEVVAEELGAEPMQETTELYEAILDGYFPVTKPVPAIPSVGAEGLPPSPPGQNPLDPIARGPLVGREREMAFLQDRYGEASAGQGGLVLVRGEAGMGKTRLVEELAGELRWQGVRVLWGRCYAFERLLPYQPLAEALQAALSTITATDLEGIPSWVVAELARLVPDLSEKQARMSDRSEVPLDQERGRLFEAVAQFLADLSRGGALALLLDDLHWATDTTLQLVHYLARHEAPHPVLFVGTLRPEAVGPQHPLHDLQRQLSREGLLRSLDLPGLSPRAVESLLVEMSGGGQAVLPLAQRLYEETEGNPFFLTETVKALFDAGLVRLESGAWRGDFVQVSQAALPLPQGVSEAIRARVGRLDEDVQQALQAAAVLGSEFDYDLLVAVWRQGEEPTLEALDALLRRRFVDEGRGALGRDYVFHHHKIQEVVYAGIPLRRRQHLHARAGRAMETLYASSLEAVAGELAFHFQEARSLDPALKAKAVQYLLLAGDQARLAYAHHEAINYYQQALRLQREEGDYEQAARTLMKLGLAHHTGFDFAESRRAFAEAFSQWQQAGRQELGTLQPPAPHPLRIRWRCPYTLDPAFCGEYVSSLVLDQIFSGLVSTGPELDIVPEVAQTWQVLDGGRRYRFHLRADARWSDGMPLTAHDFEYAWKRVLDPASGGIASELLAIKGARAFHQREGVDADQLGIRALDDTTLDVELEEPVSHFLYVLTDSNAFPVPRHVVEAQGAAWTELDSITTNGPFRPEAWDRDRYLSLVRNPYYAGRCRGNVEQVMLHFPQDPATQDLSAPLEQYLRGDLDVLTLTDASVHDGDRIRRQFAAEYLSAPWLFTIYLGFVTNRSPLDDVRLRQALALGANREELADVVLRGMYAPGTGGFVPPGMPGHSPQIGLPYDPDRARQLLVAAGHAAGSRLPVLEGLSVPPIDPLIPQYLQAQWQENLGVQVAWEVADWLPFRQRLQQDPPHMYLLASFADWPDPGDFLPPHLELARTRWQSRSYEELVKRARHTLNQEARLDLLRQADQIIIQQASIVPLFYGRQHMLIKPWVRSFPISALNHWYCKDVVIEPH
ncbi:MAG: ABC transporter substrate-binding protein [Anaerolineae bacterium]|nr:ABC transporter substrate-binding protein [Anaerolineae bacterium]